MQSKQSNNQNTELRKEILRITHKTKLEDTVKRLLQQPNADVWSIYAGVMHNKPKDCNRFDFTSRIFPSRLNSPTQPQAQLVQPQACPAKTIIFQEAPMGRKVQTQLTEFDTNPPPAKNSPRLLKNEEETKEPPQKRFQP